MTAKILALACLLALGAAGQTVAPANDFAVLSGTDAASGIRYALISVTGKLSGGPQPAAAPRLTAQCTQDAKGKLHFELLADFGDAPGLRYIPPFKPTAYDRFPPEVERVDMTMDFLGYRKVKPVRRQWSAIYGLPREWRYATPGLSSPNMEEVMFYLQYLKALPTLRLTRRGPRPVAAEFETARWQARLKAEPLCWASTL